MFRVILYTRHLFFRFYKSLAVDVVKSIDLEHLYISRGVTAGLEASIMARY